MYKAGQRQLRVSDRVLDIPVSEKTLDAEGIDATRLARSYPHEPQQMRVNGKIAKAGRLCGAIDHLANVAAFRDKQGVAGPESLSSHASKTRSPCLTIKTLPLGLDSSDRMCQSRHPRSSE
jgi:hypothetical protein